MESKDLPGAKQYFQSRRRKQAINKAILLLILTGFGVIILMPLCG